MTMLRRTMTSRIHRATITSADLHHGGALTLDTQLIAGARLGHPGDLVILIADADVPDPDVPAFRPPMVFVAAGNRIVAPPG